MIIMYSDGVLGAGKKWKHYLGLIFTPLRLSEPDNTQSEPSQTRDTKREGWPK